MFTREIATARPIRATPETDLATPRPGRPGPSTASADRLAKASEKRRTRTNHIGPVSSSGLSWRSCHQGEWPSPAARWASQTALGQRRSVQTRRGRPRRCGTILGLGGVAAAVPGFVAYLRAGGWAGIRRSTRDSGR
jgi:hypothetical protein